MNRNPGVPEGWPREAPVEQEALQTGLEQTLWPTSREASVILLTSGGSVAEETFETLLRPPSLLS